MLSFIKSSLKQDEIPAGIFPKRQVVGTSVLTTSTTVVTTTSIIVSMSTTETTDTTTLPPVSSSPPIVLSSTTTTPTSTTSTTTSTSSTTPVVPESQPSQTTPTSTTTQTTPTSQTTTTAISTSLSTSTIADDNTSTTPLASTGSGSSSNLVVVGSSTIDRSTLTGATTITSALLGVETDAVLSTSYWTSNGQTYSSVYTSTRVKSSTTGYATATIEPVLAGDGSGAGNSMSPHSAAIIGGVVGGVGGAILLGGLLFVAWRLWRKQRGTRLPQDDYYGAHDEVVQKESDTNGLERYRTPGRSAGPAMSVNASTNY